MYQDIYEYIKTEETLYQTVPVPVVEGYEWSMFDHVKRTTLYLNSEFVGGNKGNHLPFKNIILPKINLEHRAVEFGLKEIEFFIDNKDEYYKSFLVRKFHDKWAPLNGINGFLDKLTETYTDYGGVLIKNTKTAPEVVPFQRLAFCDQTDILSGPICEKHQYSPDQLKDMESVGWGNSEYGATHTIDEVITLSRSEKTVTQADGQVTKTPGKYIEIYELHGTLPESYLNEGGEPTKFIPQIQIVAYYTNQENKKCGITLFKSKETESKYKFKARDPIYGRALGRGGVEELFQPQVWVNYSELQRKELLDQASKILYQTADTAFSSRNTLKPKDHGDVLVYEEGKPLTQVNTNAVNVTAFENAITAWDSQGKDIAAAYDSISGDNSGAKVPFRSSMLFNQEAHSLHKYRKSQVGDFLIEIYRDWNIPKISKEIIKGDEFLSNLSLDEMQSVSEQVIASVFNKSIIKKLLGGDGEEASTIQPGEQEALLEVYKQDFFSSGNKKFLEILKDEMKGLALDVSVNISDEDKNGAIRAEKLSGVFTQASNILMAQPNFFNDHPEMAKVFNDILESSGLSPMMYGAVKTPQPQIPQPTQPQQPSPVGAVVAGTKQLI
jgi:hypothetical protein